MADKEHRGHDEKETDTSEDTELKEHHTDDKDSDETHTKQTLDRTLEDSVAELFHQGFFQFIRMLNLLYVNYFMSLLNSFVLCRFAWSNALSP